MDGSLRFEMNNAKCSAGGMFTSHHEELKISGWVFTSNIAKFGDGGAVSMVGFEKEGGILVDCLFKNNTARDGGAISFYAKAGNDTISNSIFDGNYACMT